MIAAWQRFDLTVSRLVPALCTLCLLAAGLLPIGLGPLKTVQPDFVLMAVFYWSARIPALFPPLLALVAGIAADLTDMTPFGSQALLFALIPFVFRHRRRKIARKSFFWLWGGFAVLTLAQIVFLFLIAAALSGIALPLAPLLLRAFTSIACFPLVVKFILTPVEHLATKAQHV